RLPSNGDQPSASFFFDAGTSGGRILVDLGKSTKVRQVNTYSWHGGPRGPQVYRLYASEGSAKGFDAKTARGDALEKTGWTLIASVDTRPKSGKFGGQYGVSVSDSSGGVIGAFRYLLFDVSPTEKIDRFGNTFFSEIDVSDGEVHKPAPRPGIETVSIAGKCEMFLDYSEMPELKGWIDKSLKPVCVKWYPIIVKMLADEGYKAPSRFSVTFRRDMRGVAATGGTRIYCAGKWFKHNLQGEALGAVVHEMVHVVQQYHPIRGRRRNPAWMVEGVADYIRWFCYEPKSKRPRVNPARAKYTDSYRTTAAFIHYAVENCDKDIVRKFNAEMRKGRYAPELWKKYTGKTIDELWAEYVKTLPKR
ncbi:MAG: basic secretory protein-like protein, partial [Phycisphaerae bacterium]|nr:basic secretory protein-like protein [Phycisphaerae bacterium]